MNNETDQIKDLLRRLLEAFIDHPSDLTVDAKELPGRVDWKIKVHADDYGKVAGRQGAHIQALQFIVSKLGEVIGEDFRLALREPDPGPRRGRSPEKKARSYDPSDASLLLQELLGEILQLPPQVEVDQAETPDGYLLFTFKIKPELHQDHDALIAHDEMFEGQTLIAALQTLFRAYANREGVIFQLEEAP